MAMRTKTTWWGFPTDTASVANSTLRTFASQTIYAETNSRVIKSAIVEVYSMDQCTATGCAITECRVGVSVNGAGYTTVTELDDYTTSSEQIGLLYSADFTAQFTTNFASAASTAVLVQMYWTLATGTTLTTINACAILKLTYEFDDAATNCIKTMVIPLESFISTPPSSTPASMGTNQIPIITGASGIIKEVSAPTIRDYFFIIEGNENDAALTTDISLLTRIDDAGATFTSGLHERALASNRSYRYVWSLKSAVPDTTIVHNFQMGTAATAFHHPTVKLVVTYEFTRADAAATSVSIQIPFRLPDAGATTAADQQVIRVPFDIQEPGTVTLRQSGIELHWDIVPAVSVANYLNVAIGSQAIRSYTDNLGTASTGPLCGEQVLLQRLDSGAAQGAGATLARGQNYVDLKIYTGARSTIAGISGVLYLNYSTNAVPATGIDSANHTTWKNISNWDFSLPVEYLEIAAVAPAYIAETYYAIQSTAAWVTKYWHGTVGVSWACLYAEVLSGEGTLGVADGWKIIDAFRPSVIAEVGYYYCAGDCPDLFKRWPGDPKANQMDIETARKWRLYSTRGSCAIQWATTYHSIYYTGTKAITGFTGTGALPVKIHDYTSGEMLYEVTAAVGGVYTYIVYDNTRQLISRTYEAASGLAGASEPWTAT